MVYWPVTITRKHDGTNPAWQRQRACPTPTREQSDRIRSGEPAEATGMVEGTNSKPGRCVLEKAFVGEAEAG